ncbi:MAG: Dabb family protein [Ginsengibacter sp.]
MIIEKNGFIHHVFFWLKDAGSSQAREQLIEGLRKLSKAPTIKDFHIGIPANTNRDVIDSSYAASWLLLFDSAEDQDIYQTDPVHLKFIEECSHLWSKVVVYDTISIDK